MINDEYTPDLEQDENETQDVQEETNESEDTQEQTQTTHEDEKDWKAEALKYKAILDRNKDKPRNKESSKSDDFGYDVKAYLKASGVSEKEFDFVKAEKEASGIKDYDALLSNEYFQAKLEKHRQLAKTTDAIPKGSRSNGGATDSVDYWMGKPIEEVPRDMRIKVVQAKLAKDKNKGGFYNS